MTVSETRKEALMLENVTCILNDYHGIKTTVERAQCVYLQLVAVLIREGSSTIPVIVPAEPRMLRDADES